MATHRDPGEKLRAEIDGVLTPLVGKRITSYEVGQSTIHGKLYDRLNFIRLKVEGVGWIKVDYWAAYEEDGSLEVELDEAE